MGYITDNMDFVYALIAFASMLCVLERKIDTDQIIRSFGFLVAGVGAHVQLEGRENFIVWIGVIVVILTYVVDLWDWACGKPKHDRRVP
jgi:hypothetical protein